MLRIHGEVCATSFREKGTIKSLSSDYLTSITQIIDHGLKTNSYKFALLRALGDSVIMRFIRASAALLVGGK
jgi:hypothetical protein